MKEIERCQKDPSKLVNPDTGRCILEKSPIIKKLLSEGYTIVVTPETVVPNPPKSVKVFQICPTDSSKLVNPLTGRCIKQESPTIKKLMSEGWTIALSKKTPSPLLIKPKKELDYEKIIKKLDKNKDGIIVINEYLAKKEITTSEQDTKKGLYIGIYDTSNIYKFLSIQRESDIILQRNLCIYKQHYYISWYPNVKRLSYKNVSIDKNNNYNHYMVTHGIVICNAPLSWQTNKKMEIITHPDLVKYIKDCKERFLIIPLTLMHFEFRSTFIKSGINRDVIAHQNILIFDNLNKTIDRFDPHGKKDGISVGHTNIGPPAYNNTGIDAYLKRYTKKILPSYKYIELQLSCPYLGPQMKADKASGYCVTWSLMFTLLRLLNPDVPVQDLIKAMLEGTREELVKKLGRFAKFYTDKIKKIKI